MSHTPRIAVVEDEEAISELLRYNLEAEGYQVDTILRGDEAEIHLRDNVLDLAVLDVEGAVARQTGQQHRLRHSLQRNRAVGHAWPR